MGLAGGIVRKIFRSPCSSSSEHSQYEKGSNDHHRRRWSSIRLHLCGDELNAALEEDELVYTKATETTTVMQQVEETSANEQSYNAVKREEPEEEIAKEEQIVQRKVLSEEDAATLIQSAFRGLMARKQFKDMNSFLNKDFIPEPQSPSLTSVPASVEVQVGESFSTLSMSGDNVTVQHRVNQKARPPMFKEEWDDSTLSSNVLKMRVQSKLEATTKRERAMAYAFSQQLRSCNTKKRTSRSDQTEFNVGWSWLERWMATRQPENSSADDCLSKNTDSVTIGRRVIVIKKRCDFAVEEKESCGSNDVSVSFDGSNKPDNPGNSYKQVKNRLKTTRNVQRRKVASDHRCPPRSCKLSKKGRHREEVEGSSISKQEQPKN